MKATPIRRLISSILFAIAPILASAASTDIATAPLITSNTTQVRPNVMYIIDDSGSMDWDFVPDWANDYYCKRATGSINVSGNSDNYSTNSLCCRNRSSDSSSCMSGSSFGSGSTGRRGDVPFATSDINNIYYNPAIAYTPPKNADGTSKNSQTCANTGGSGSPCTNGWTSVKLDAYGVQESASTVRNLITSYPDVSWCYDGTFSDCRTNTNYFYPNQTFNVYNAIFGSPYYYLIIPGEYCNSDKLTSCVAATAPTGVYTYPATLRWCNDTGLTTCQAIKNATYKYPRYPTLMPSNSNSGSVTTVITISGSSTASSNKPVTVNGITVATGPALMTSATASASDIEAVTDNIIAKIGNGYVVSPKTCAVSGSTKTCSITLLAPSSGTCPSGAITPSLTHGAGATTISISATPEFTSCTVPGQFVRINIDSGTNSYSYPGTNAKHANRTDCTGTTCTYDEEMTNFANWFTYYRTRMQMMKTASSQAFHGINDAYRVGFLSINNNTNSAFLNAATFDSGQKSSWYTKLFASNPNNGTPLRSALSTAGLLYAGSLNGQTLNGSTVVDPVQYSCQQNFTILSTDGYWNTGNDSGCSGRSGQGCKVDRTSAIGNTDGGEKPPFGDGRVVTTTDITPSVTQTVTTAARTITGNSSRTDTTVSTDQRTLTDSYTRTRITTSTTGCGGGQKKVRTRLYSGTDNKTEKTITTSTQLFVRTTTTDYTDTTTTTVTDTRTIVYTLVTTNGISTNVITSDTTTSNTVGPATTSVISAGPTSTAWTASGAPSTNVVGPTVTSTGVVMSGSTYSDSTTACITTATTASDSTALTSAGAWSAISTIGPNTTAGTVSTISSTANGASSTVTTGPTLGTTNSTTTGAGGTSDSLADVAYYYYTTDLRPTGSIGALGFDVSTNNVPPSNSDPQTQQHMTTFTLGLGIDGYMKFNPKYASVNYGDFYDVANGQTATASRCTWQAAGTTCTWPAPSSDSQANIDDLWHAAVNGRGTYFSAKNPAELATGLTNALAGVTQREGAAAAASSSNPNVTSSDNFLFSSQFTTREWSGEIVRRRLDPTTGAEKAIDSTDWNAQAKLDVKVATNSDSRNIFTFTTDTSQTAFCGNNFNSGGKLKPLCWTGNSTAYPSATSLSLAEQAYFTLPTIGTMTQFCASSIYTLPNDPVNHPCLDASQQSDASGAKLTNYLRGRYGNEDRATNTDRYFRTRAHVLGDIVSSEAAYVKIPRYEFTDTGFSTYKLAQASRQAMLYVAANDGMLHALNGDTGEEAWAFIPSMVLPKLHKLADMNYANNHEFLLDGTPITRDAYINGEWKTILVGGLGAGGSGYYALDITDPATPKGLWEFKRKTSSCALTVAAAIGQTEDCDLGMSMGNPIVTKLADGTWVVLVTSGYNNTTPGDGKGYLYILNAATGAIVRKIGTEVGSNSTIPGVCDTAPCPSGLAKINAWIDNINSNNSALRVYGGDLFGNLWRFDINDNVGAAGYEALLLTTFKGPNNVQQPITTKPELGRVNGIAMVYVGTGRYLGNSDNADTSQTGLNKQSIYGVKDSLSDTGWGVFRAANVVGQTLNSSRVTTTESVDLATKAGWYIDLRDSGERANTDPTLSLGKLVFNVNIPNNDACTTGGTSYQYQIDYRTGIGSATLLGNALANRPLVLSLESGGVITVTTLADTQKRITPLESGPSTATLRRVSWRQLLDQ